MNIDYSVAEALMEHSVGDVATAIEQQSCYHGRDRFGRLKLLDENEKEKILKLLEDYYLQERFWYTQEVKDEDTGEVPSDIFDCNYELPHWYFGWSKEHIPEVLKSKSNSKIKTQDKEGLKGRYTLLIIIGTLCKIAKVDFNKRGIAKRIAIDISTNVGVSMTEKTIKGILNEIPDAIERRKQ